MPEHDRAGSFPGTDSVNRHIFLYFCYTCIQDGRLVDSVSH